MAEVKTTKFDEGVTTNTPDDSQPHAVGDPDGSNVQHAVTVNYLNTYDQGKRNNLDAVTDPTASDDDSVTPAYEIGSLWYNSTASASSLWVCEDASTGAAVWREVIMDHGAQTIAGTKTFSNDVIVNGDLTVSGTTTTVDTTNTTIKDANIEINKGGNDASSEGAGLTVERTGTNVTLQQEDGLASKWKAGAAGSESEVMTVGTAQTVSGVKTHSATPDFDAGTQFAEISTPSNPPASSQKLYPKSDGNFYKLDSSGVESQLGGGSGVGGVNLLSNGSFDNGVTGWTRYANTSAGVAPDDFGGSASATSVWDFEHNTSTQLRGLGSGRFNKKTATNIQGEGVYSEFDLDTADVGRINTLAFLASTSANYSDGNIRVYLVSSSDNFVADFDIQEFPQRDLNASDLLNYISQIQISTDNTKSRLCFHVASTDTDIYTVDLDGDPEAMFGPIKASIGSIVTDWEDFTPTGSFTNTTYTGKKRRVGNMLEARYHLLLTGTPGASNLNLDLPSGLSMDTSILLDTTSFGVLGTGTTYDSSGGFYNLAHAYYVDSNTVSVVNHKADLTYAYQAQTSTSAPYTFAVNDEIFIELKVPIAGWSGNTSSSVLFPNREIKMQASKNSGNHSASGSFQTVAGWSTPSIDSVGAFNATTGEYTVKEAGNHNLDAVVSLVASAGGTLRTIYAERVKVGGGSEFKRGTIVGSSASLAAALMVHADFQCDVGDVLRVATFQDSGGNLNYTADGAYNHISVHKVQSPQTLLSTESLDNEVRFEDANNHGSINTAIRRFNSLAYNRGTAFTVSQSATLGDSVTINLQGRFAISYSDGANTEQQFFGVTRNSAQLTTQIFNTTKSTRLMEFSNGIAGAGSDQAASSCWIGRLDVGDVIRAHTDGFATDQASIDSTIFTITYLGPVGS